MNHNQTLLVIDAQINMFDEDFSVYQPNKLIIKLRHLVEQARLKGIPVIWIRNNGGKGEPDEPGSHGWNIHPSLNPKKDEVVIDKYEPSAFKDTNLLSILKQNRISDLIIAGMQTEVCINSTVRKAVEFGFNVILVKDGHSTFDSDEMKAIKIIEKFNEDLSNIAKIVKAGDIIF